MANDKKTEQALNVEQRLKTLYELQTILSEIDRIKTIRGELPLEVKDLEDNIARLQTRIENFKREIDELQVALSGEKEKNQQLQNTYRQI
jgi:predicted  nucleic acid-binding Zn-ribbon protein